MKDMCMVELMEALDERGITYEEVLESYERIYITSHKNKVAYMRVSHDEGALGYYVRHTGVIYDDVSLEDVLEMAERL